MDYSPWSSQESDTTEYFHFHFHLENEKQVRLKSEDNIPYV